MDKSLRDLGKYSLDSNKRPDYVYINDKDIVLLEIAVTFDITMIK